MPQDAEDLIDELKEICAKQGGDLTSLVVQIGRGRLDFVSVKGELTAEDRHVTVVPCPPDSDPLQELHFLIDNGGKPVSFVTIVMENNRSLLAFQPRIFPEFTNDDSILCFFENVFRFTKKVLEESVSHKSGPNH